MDIPSIELSKTAIGKHHPDCCLGLSEMLLRMLNDMTAKPPDLTLSIGSGTGLLEALFLRHNPEKRIYGVEVNDSVNKYLPQEMMHIVGGTRDTDPAAAEATVWLFVYPREPDLVARYIEAFGDGKVERIIWYGPFADVRDYYGLFRDFTGFRDPVWVRAVGTAEYEAIAWVEKEGTEDHLSTMQERNQEDTRGFLLGG